MFRGFNEFLGKNWLISRKSMKNHRFGENLPLFEQTIMFGGCNELSEKNFLFEGFDELFGKKLQNVADFVKKHEKSSTWPKLATFRANHHVSRFS